MLRVSAFLLLAAGCIGDTLTVDDAAALAVASYPEIVAARARAASQEWGLVSARGAGLPDVDASLSYTRMGGGRTIEIASPFGAQEVSLIEESFVEAQGTVSQVVYSGGSVSAATEASRAGVRIGSAALRAIEDDVAARAREAAFDVLRADAISEVAEQSAALAREHLRVSRAFVDAGLQPRSAVLRAEVAVADAEKTLVVASNARALARQTLNSLVSRPLDAPVFVVEPDHVDSLPPLDEDMASYQKLAVANNPRLASSRAAADASEAAERLASSAFLPKVIASGGYTYHFNTEEDHDRYGTWMIGGKLLWNLFNGGSDRAALESRREDVRAVRSDYDALAAALELAVARAVLACRESAARNALAMASAASSEENHRMVSRRYAEGLATQVDELDAETALSAARMDCITSLYDYHVSLVRLEALLGAHAGDAR